MEKLEGHLMDIILPNEPCYFKLYAVTYLQTHLKYIFDLVQSVQIILEIIRGLCPILTIHVVLLNKIKLNCYNRSLH